MTNSNERLDREFMTTTQATLASINASNERQDRILDYLLRREDEGNGNQPPQ